MSDRHVHFDFADLSTDDRNKLLISTIVPRPIAFVTTVGADGHVNAAPFSFFNCLAPDPPLVVLGIGHRDGQSKDTARNIRATGEFTVNIVSDAMAEAMSVASAPFGPEVNEIAAAGLTEVAGQAVACPRILESPASFECRRYMGVDVGDRREIVIGEVLGLHLRDDVVDSSNLYIDAGALDAIGRMGGRGYTRTRERFELRTTTLDDWESGNLPRRSEGD